MDRLPKRPRILTRAAIATGNDDTERESNDNQHAQSSASDAPWAGWANAMSHNGVFREVQDFFAPRSREDRAMQDATNDHSRQMDDRQSRAEEEAGIDRFEQHERQDRENGADTKLA